VVWAEVEKDAVRVVLLGSFPSQVAAWGRSGIDAFMLELAARDLGPHRAIAAIRAHDGKFGAPTAGAILGIADRQVQGPAPTFLEAARLVGARVSMLDYFRPASNFHELVERLADEHEAVGRFVVALGPRGAKEMPDPQRGDSYAVGRYAKDYGEVVRAWEADPTPGVAAGEARRRLEGGAGAAIGEARRELARGGGA